jgi:hypothetical protein
MSHIFQQSPKNSKLTGVFLGKSVLGAIKVSFVEIYLISVLRMTLFAGMLVPGAFKNPRTNVSATQNKSYLHGSVREMVASTVARAESLHHGSVSPCTRPIT